MLLWTLWYLFRCEPCMNKIYLQVPPTPYSARIGHKTEVNAFSFIPKGFDQIPSINLKRTGYSSSSNKRVSFLQKQKGQPPSTTRHSSFKPLSAKGNFGKAAGKNFDGAENLHILLTVSLEISECTAMNCSSYGSSVSGMSHFSSTWLVLQRNMPEER